MKYNITEKDKQLLLQPVVDYNYRLLIVDNKKNVLGELDSLQSIGNYSINSESSIRRTTSFVMYLASVYKEQNIEEKLAQWIGYNFELQIGIYSIRDDNYNWYKCGYYMITEANTTYDSINNSISTNLADWYSKLDGTRNGQIGGAPIIQIPNIDEEGNPNTIKEVTEGLLRFNTTINDYIVDDIGEFYGMMQNNPDYLTYRKQNPLWNQLPYDMKFEAGCYVSNILEELVNLYPNCQMYFDIYGNFCFNMIPSCEYDDIVLDNDYLQKIIVADNSENVTYSINDIKNVTEIFGEDYEIDRYSTECTTSTNIYTILLDNFTEYSTGEYIAFTPNTSNIANMKVRINSLDTLPIYYEFTSQYISENEIIANEAYVLLIKKVNGEYVSYYLGQYQPHALCVLTNNANDTKYSKSYFARKYNCKEHNIVLRVEEDSPFTVQKLGEILDCKTGDEFNNILSNSVAKENAIYYNKKSSSVHDTVTITTRMIPFIDTNTKVEYKKQQDSSTHQYIIKEVEHSIANGTTTITMYRFYPLYYAD